MNEARRIRRKQLSQSGAALLLAIFALMLISVVAIALVVSQGTDSALAGNYRTSIGAYYAGVAGLEEARGRLSWKNTNCLGTRPAVSPTPPYCATPVFLPMVNNQPAMALTDVRYIINPVSGDPVDPSAGKYQDTEYATEFTTAPITPLTTTNSVWPIAGLEGPNYKWLRINPVTEKALNIDVNHDGVIDGATPLLYDPAAVVAGSPPTLAPSLIFPSLTPTTPTAMQALEITSLAVMPNGGHRILQYIVAPLTASTSISTQPTPTIPPPGLNLNFPAALTIPGANVTVVSSNYHIYGQDESPACSPPPSPAFMVPAIGYTTVPSGSAMANITAGASPGANYSGGMDPVGGSRYATPSGSSFNDVTYSLRQSWQTPDGLDAVVQDITKNADYVYQGNTNATAFNSLGMSAITPPLTIVVNGNLDMTSWPHVGTGLLLVTGTLTYDANMTWEGIILVIGRGRVDFVSNGFGGGIDGAMFIAQTRNFANNLLAQLGPGYFKETSGSGSYGRGLNYNSCNVNQTGAQTPLGYKILSFREIPTS